MAKPVKNWQSQINGTPIFRDIVDSDLRHYGPRATWRELTRNDIGQKKVIFTGIIDFGYSTDELALIAAKLNGKRILPLSLSTINQEPKIGIDISAPHVGGLVSLNSLPFPQYRLAITIDLQAPDAGLMINTIQDGWTKKTLLRGMFVSVAEGLFAKAGYKVKIDVRSCISEIIATERKHEFSKTEAWKSIEAAVQKNSNEWLVYFGEIEGTEDANYARTALIQLLNERCFIDTTLIQYDNGIKVMASKLRDELSMSESEFRVFVSSSPEKIITEINF